MTVHLFGGTSSPSCANFALRKTADDNEGDVDPETIQTIRRNFYVDDCLKAVKSESLAVKLADQLSACLAKGGFRLTKSISNSSPVIELIPESERAPSLRKLDFVKSKHVERPLGVQWNVATDTFGFTITIKDRPLTRTERSSLYRELDLRPPGFRCLPYPTGKGDTARPVPKEPRKLFRDSCIISLTRQEGYGAVSYLRVVNTRGDIHCSFVLGKSRLAPLKPTTIPRMELSAAVVATRLEKMIQEELEEKPTCRSIFWSDSTCVLRYVDNEDKRFQIFVANKITTIRVSLLLVSNGDMSTPSLTLLTTHHADYQSTRS